MTEAYSKSRQMAEVAFGNAQTQFFAKDKAVEELLSVAQSREAKTLRLSAARLSRELADRTAATSALLAKRTRTK